MTGELTAIGVSLEPMSFFLWVGEVVEDDMKLAVSEKSRGDAVHEVVIDARRRV